MTDADVSTYACMDGYLCGEGSDTVTGTDTCPADKYCTAGAENDCSYADAFSNVGGLADDSECVRCPPGKICPSRSVGQIDCPEGSYCPGGHSSTADADIETCDAGHYCPAGSAMQTKCEPGTYQGDPGMASCDECPVGKYCLEPGTSTPTDCATYNGGEFQHWYCPAGSVYPTVCPPGYYGDGTTACTACPAGQYCWPVADDGAGGWEPAGISGDCDHASGFICQGGSWSPKPQYNGLEFIVPGSSDFSTYNGPVVEGYIAVAADQ